MGGAIARHVTRALLLCLGALFLLITPAGAADEARILRLDELLPALRVAFGATLDCTVPLDTPLLLPAGVDRESEKALRVALANAGLTLREAPGVLRLERVPGPDDRAQARARLRALAPQRPAPGPDLVQRGLVILQGRLLAPPFRIEATADAVLLNGVAVYPVPGAPQAPPAVSAAQAEAFAERLAAIAVYRETRDTQGEAQARSLCLERMAELPGVRSGRWVGEGVQLDMADGSEETVVLAPRERRPEPPTSAEIAARMSSEAAALRRVLGEGGSALIGSTYLLTLQRPSAGSLRTQAEVILASPEAEALKLLRLQALLGHRHAAADLLYASEGGRP